MHFTWASSKPCDWKPKVRKTGTLGYLQVVSPLSNDRERYYVSLLLQHVRGPESFDDLKLGHDTFEEACLELGIIGSDPEYINNFLSAGQNPDVNRESFAQLLSTKSIPFPSQFISDVFRFLAADLNEDHRRKHGFILYENESVRDLADVAMMERAYLLFLIDNIVPDMTMEDMNFSASDIVLCDSFVAPPLVRDNALDPSFGYDHDYRHTSADPEVHEMQLSRLTPVQRSHFETITKAVLEGPDDGKNIFFLDAPAGSGKTFSRS